MVVRVKSPYFDNFMQISEEQFYVHAKFAYELDFECSSVTNKSYAKSIKDLNDESSEPCFMVKPLFYECQFFIMVAEEKVGKSMFALDISLMTASGESIDNRLSATKPYKTLYIDTENPVNEVNRRIQKMRANYRNQDLIDQNLMFLFAKNLPNDFNLLKKEHQIFIEDEIKRIDAKFVVFDNLGGLASPGSDKSETKWGVLSKWFKHCTSRGITVLLVHHFNKSGVYRGTGKITDDVSLVLSLKKPDDCPDIKTIITINIESARMIYGKQREPFDVEYGEELNRINQTGDDENDEHVDGIVSEEDNYQYGRLDLKKEILKIARASENDFITAANFKTTTKVKGKSKSAITKKLNELSGNGLLVKIGKTKGAKYYLPERVPKNVIPLADEPQ